MDAANIKKNGGNGGDIDPASDVLWGYGEIARFIGRNPGQAAYMQAHGLFGDAVKKLSHKVVIGSKQRLRELMYQPRKSRPDPNL